MFALLIIAGIGLLIFAISRIQNINAQSDAEIEKVKNVSYEQLYSDQSRESLRTVLMISLQFHLRSPASAVLCPNSDLQITGPKDNGKFKVQGYVDAQNGFGAMVRSNFHATCTFTPDTQTWSVDNIWGLDR